MPEDNTILSQGLKITHTFRCQSKGPGDEVASSSSSLCRLSPACDVYQQGSLVSRASCILPLAPSTRKMQLTTGQLAYYVELCTIVTDPNSSSSRGLAR